MFKVLVQLSALGAIAITVAFGAACGSAHDDFRSHVTIDVRCGSNADCPKGFVCESDAEHGPPTTMCESYDPGATCPRAYETHVGYGQIFCIPRLGVRESMSLAEEPRESGRAH